MRITRAAKVAALPLLAMVLVVALIACQGPVGETGKSIKGDTGAGTTGTPGDDALEAASIDVVIFNPVVSDDDEATDLGQDVTIDLSTHLTGGVAEGRKYKIVNTSGWIETVADDAAGAGEYVLTGSMLKLSVPEPFMPGTAHAEDALILVEATDADGEESAVLYVKVRGNLAPDRDDNNGQPFGLTVGTQAAASADGDDPDYHTADNITCPTLNVCMVDLSDVFSDDNLRDSMTWMVDFDSEDITAVKTANGVMITGLKAQATPIAVRVWPVDEGDLPVNIADDVDDTDRDETASPGDADVQVINVTVDGAPYMGSQSQSSIELTAIGVPGKTVGTVFDPEGVLQGTTLDSMTIEYTPQIQPNAGDVQIVWDMIVPGTDTNPLAQRPLVVIGLNPGPVTVDITVSENPVDDTPTQWVKHTVAVTVSGS